MVSSLTSPTLTEVGESKVVGGVRGGIPSAGRLPRRSWGEAEWGALALVAWAWGWDKGPGPESVSPP